MREKFYRILLYLLPAGFLLYWSVMISSSMPAGYGRNVLSKKIPGFTNTIGFEWKFFTPPYRFNHRLYCIVAEATNHQRADTIEVLENISLQKQRRAPFNQPENIMDYLVNKELIRFVTASKNKQQYSEDYQLYLSSLINYCKLLLVEKGITSTGKEIKLLVKARMMRPFKERANPQFVQPDILIAETSFIPLTP